MKTYVVRLRPIVIHYVNLCLPFVVNEQLSNLSKIKFTNTLHFPNYISHRILRIHINYYIKECPRIVFKRSCGLLVVMASKDIQFLFPGLC